MLENKIEHLAVIMDGNRRWSKLNNLDFFDGHKKGSENIRLLIELAIEEGIKYLSVYAFSSENWNRSQREILYLKELMVYYLESEKEYFINNKIKLKVIGEYEAFGEEISSKIDSLQEATKDFDKITLIVALNYGSRAEIIRATKQISEDIKNNKISEKEITEHLFSKYLYTRNIPDPDLIIRTGGEQRLSNFLLWQLSYSEMLFENIMWPDFNKESFNKAIKIFYGRERRIGK